MRATPSLLLAGVVAGLAGCAALPKVVDRPQSRALDDTDSTALGRLYWDAETSHAGESGFVLLEDGRRSATARVALIDIAERTIDVQTFTWNRDVIGRVFWSRLFRAAERGVRVRVLVDDLEMDDGHFGPPTPANFEVRVFNPFAQRKLFRFLELLRRFATLNRRMHNKLFIVDNQVAFVGGRNVGDEYFGLARSYNFRDLDVMAVGPVVAQASNAFDEYWNSPWAFPVSAFEKISPAETARRKERMHAALMESTLQYPYPLDLPPAEIFSLLGALRDELCWGAGEVLWDPPSKLLARHDGDGPPGLKMLELGGQARREVVIESAYFVPRLDLLGIRAIARRGVDVHILTNSLDSTDRVTVHAGYQRVRRSLIDSGVKLHELRPDAAIRRLHIFSPSRDSRLGLHAKVAIFDRETLLIGSLNLDPRSHYLDTEVVLVAHCPRLAERAFALVAPDFDPGNSYFVTVGPNGGLEWIDRESGSLHRSGFEPHVFLRKLEVILLALLPIDSLI
jgi:putative cardiolipin synthase